MSDRTPQEELEILRVSVARIAQTLGLQGYIPGHGLDPNYEASFGDLCKFAKCARGWNALCAAIVDDLRRER